MMICSDVDIDVGWVRRRPERDGYRMSAKISILDLVERLRSSSAGTLTNWSTTYKWFWQLYSEAYDDLTAVRVDLYRFSAVRGFTALEQEGIADADATDYEGVTDRRF